VVRIYSGGAENVVVSFTEVSSVFGKGFRRWWSRRDFGRQLMLWVRGDGELLVGLEVSFWRWWWVWRVIRRRAGGDRRPWNNMLVCRLNFII